MTVRKHKPLIKNKIRGARRKSFKMRDLKATQQQILNKEGELLAEITRNALNRGKLETGMGIVSDISVYADSNLTWPMTTMSPKEIPKWRDLSEAFKFKIGFMALVAHNQGWAFTGKLHPDVEAKWVKNEIDPTERISRNLNKHLRARGVVGLAFGFVVEGKTKTGKSPTGLHVHGYFEARDPFIMTKFKVALERTLSTSAGMNSKGAIKLEPGYDTRNGMFMPDRWPSYDLKNALRRDKRIPNRRIYQSQELKKLQKEFHGFMREEPPV